MDNRRLAVNYSSMVISPMAVYDVSPQAECRLARSMRRLRTEGSMAHTYTLCDFGRLFKYGAPLAQTALSGGYYPMRECCRIEKDSIHIAVKALPGASKTEFAGVKDGRLRIRVAAAPEGGRANAELVSFVARAAGCAKHDVVLVRGEKSRLKTLALPRACELPLDKIIGEVLS